MVLPILAACQAAQRHALPPALPPVLASEEARALAYFSDRATQFRHQTTGRLRALGARLRKAMGLARPVTFEVLDADEVNAYARGETVHVTLGMIRFVRNEDELALVVGHELGHMVADREAGAARLSPEDRERLADYHALLALPRAGYDIGIACEVWRRMATELAKGQPEPMPSHPSYAERYVRAHKVAEALVRGTLAEQSSTPPAESAIPPRQAGTSR